MLSQFSDREIILQLNENDPSVFEYVYDLYSKELYLHAYALLRDDYSARDVVHDVFERLLKMKGKLDPAIRLKFWLHACIRNKVISYIRKERVRSRYLDMLASALSDQECTTDHLLRENEMIRIIESAIEKLPPKMRESFEMSHIKRMKTEEIARTTNKLINTIHNQVQQALKFLKNHLPHDLMITAFALIVEKILR